MQAAHSLEEEKQIKAINNSYNAFLIMLCTCSLAYIFLSPPLVRYDLCPPLLKNVPLLLQEKKRFSIEAASKSLAKSGSPLLVLSDVDFLLKSIEHSLFAITCTLSRDNECHLMHTGVLVIK